MFIAFFYFLCFWVSGILLVSHNLYLGMVFFFFFFFPNLIEFSSWACFVFRFQCIGLVLFALCFFLFFLEVFFEFLFCTLIVLCF